MEIRALTENTVLQATAVLSLIIWTKVFVTNLGLGGAKNTAGTRAPEDTYQHQPSSTTSTNNNNDGEEEAGGTNNEEKAQQTQDRAQRIVNNDLENIPYTMVLAWGAAMCIASNSGFFVPLTAHGRRAVAYGTAHIVLYTIFVVCRIAHSIVYALKISTARSLLWLVGALCSFGIAMNGTIASFDS